VNPFAKAYQMLHDVELDELRKAQIGGSFCIFIVFIIFILYLNYLLCEGNCLPVISLIFETEGTPDPRRYNSPNSNEIAFIFKNDDGEPPVERDLKAYPKHLSIPLNSSVGTSCDLLSVDTMMNICEPMCYPLLYPYGDRGWDKNLIQAGIKNLIMRLFYYYISIFNISTSIDT
jgi:hypothetical protein